MKNNQCIIVLLGLIVPLLLAKQALASEIENSEINKILIRNIYSAIDAGRMPKLKDIYLAESTLQPRTSEKSFERPFAGIELSQAVDNHSYEFTDNSTLGFFKQDRVFNLDCDAAQSDPVADDEAAIMFVPQVGPTIASFDWKVSSHRGFDFLVVAVFGLDEEGQLVDTGAGFGISGEVDWDRRFVRVPFGVHLVVWGYVKDSSRAVGDDTGWVDNVFFGAFRQTNPDLQNTDGCPARATDAIPAMLQLLTDKKN